MFRMLSEVLRAFFHFFTGHHSHNIPQNQKKYHKIGVFDVWSSKKITAHTHAGTVGILNLDPDP
jgi:hypothetical protein